MKWLIVLFLFITALSFGQTPPLTLGSVGSVASASCPGGVGFIGSDTCFTASVTCPGTTSLGFTYSVQNPAGTVKGTIVYFAAGQATTISGELIDTIQSALVAGGYQVIKFIYGSSWWNTGSTANLLNAACRGATIGVYFYSSVHVSGLFNVIGNSAGSAAVGYWLAWYGGSSFIHFVELLNGPVFSDLSQGCQFPNASNVTVIPTSGSSWSAQVYYGGGDPGSVSTATGITCLNSGGTTGAQNTAWKAQSITAPNWITTYSNTIITAYVCNSNLNNSEGQGYLFYSQLTTPYLLTPISGCTGGEDITDGTTPKGIAGTTAVLNDMLQDP